MEIVDIRKRISRKPVDNFKVDCAFGIRDHPITKAKDFHNGIDISLPAGTKCYAIAPGTVLISKFHKSLGFYVVIAHDGFLTVYNHLKEKGASVGKKVMVGDVIGYVGSTGSSSGNHLHFEIRLGEYKSDSYFWDRGVIGNGPYPNSIDPTKVFKEVNEIEEIINATQSNPEKWIKFIEEMSKHPTGKWLPQFIKNIYDKRPL